MVKTANMTAEEENKEGAVVRVTCCGECGHNEPCATACGLDGDVEIDPDFSDDDLPSNCPMLAGGVHEKNGVFYAVPNWMRERRSTGIES